MKSKIEEEIIKKYKLVISQREEILMAFIAKYGIEPDKIIQIEWKKSPTETIWMVKPSNFSICSECEKLINKEI